MKPIHTLLHHLLVAATILIPAVHAADESSVIIGKDDWLFTRYEFATPSDAPDTQATIQMLDKTNKMFERKGITLALVIVPSKIRVNAAQLPDGTKVDAYTDGKYASAVSALRAANVNVVSLDDAFRSSPHKASDTPLFMRLDTHWSHTGAYLAAQTVKSEIEKSPLLKSVWQAVPEEKYNLIWATNKNPVRTRDLVKLLPKGSPTYPAELVLQFKVNRATEAKVGLLNGADTTLITAIGSSYSNKSTGYPDALRYVLQRNLLDISIPVDQGPWIGLEAYLQDDSFKMNKPKMIIWEIPERELRSPPNYKFRDARYVIENVDWLAKISALLQ
jgi:alginate O-acetyltransferase complex protein AlgJ